MKKAILEFIGGILAASFMVSIFYLAGVHHYKSFNLHDWSGTGRGAIAFIALFFYLGQFTNWIQKQHQPKQHENE